MTDDGGWAARMSAKAKAREQARREVAEQERAEIERPWREFVEARGGYWAAIWGEGCYVHGHPAHGGGSYDAATGRLLGVACVVIVDDVTPPVEHPDVCPICRDFPQFVM